MRTQSNSQETKLDITKILLNTKQMAERIGIAPYTLQKWVREGRITCYKPSVRIFLYDPDEVIAELKKLKS